MPDFELSYEFEPGVYIGTVLVRTKDAIHWVHMPEEPGEWQLHTDGFADVRMTDDGPMVERFGRTASNMTNPIPCWTKQHVEAFVRRKLGV